MEKEAVEGETQNVTHDPGEQEESKEAPEAQEQHCFTESLQEESKDTCLAVSLWSKCTEVHLLNVSLRA